MVALKVARIGGTGATFTTPSLKLARIGGTGTAAVILNPIADQTATPETIVTITAVLAVGGSADSYTWRQISGPTISLTTPSAASTTFLAPSTMNGTAIVVGVTATEAGTTSAEQTTTITVRPQLRWTLSASRVFVGATHDADIS